MHLIVFCGLRSIFRFRRAICVSDLPFHVRRSVLHEDSAVRIGLRHLRLPGLEPVKHVVGQDDGLDFPACRITVVPCEHIHLPLIDAKLADVCLQEKDVSALHDWVHDLCRCQCVFFAAHDLTTLRNPRQRGSPSDVQGYCPVLAGIVGDRIGTPHKFNAGHVHATSLPHLDQILAHRLDLFEVAAHLVIHQSEPIGHPEDEGTARLGAFVHIDRLEGPLGDVHAAGRLETIIQDEVWLSLEQVA
mmetsp:Transcript_79597/g.170677  ORF Transcript_79597/g.170677 Transcript_79597/m.170677 type:complete len:245 (+) Transcript_79597:1472-2206(+)